MKTPKKKKDININIDTKNVDVKVSRKNGTTEVKVDTPKVDVDFHKESDSKSLKIDTEKVDVFYQLRLQTPQTLLLSSFVKSHERQYQRLDVLKV